MTVRRLNFTKRQRIRRNEVDLEAEQVDEGISVQVGLDVSELDLPRSREITWFVEAYYGTYHFERTHLPAPNDHGDIRDEFLLKGWTEQGTVKFRFKGVESETGRLVAFGDQFQTEVGQDEQVRSLLPVVEGDLDEVWKVDFGGDAPHLVLNSDLEGLHQLSVQDEFRALVYPEVLRRILNHYFIEEELSPDDLHEDEAAYKWLAFANRLSTTEMPSIQDGKEARRQWCDDCVSAFAGELGSTSSMARLLE